MVLFEIVLYQINGGVWVGIDGVVWDRVRLNCRGSLGSNWWCGSGLCHNKSMKVFRFELIALFRFGFRRIVGYVQVRIDSVVREHVVSYQQKRVGPCCCSGSWHVESTEMFRFELTKLFWIVLGHVHEIFRDHFTAHDFYFFFNVRFFPSGSNIYTKGQHRH